MIRWEYRVVKFEETPNARQWAPRTNQMTRPGPPRHEQLAALLNACGADGWEFVQMEGAMLFFKRPVG